MSFWYSQIKLSPLGNRRGYSLFEAVNRVNDQEGVRSCPQDADSKPAPEPGSLSSGWIPSQAPPSCKRGKSPPLEALSLPNLSSLASPKARCLQLPKNLERESALTLTRQTLAPQSLHATARTRRLLLPAALAGRREIRGRASYLGNSLWTWSNSNRDRKFSLEKNPTVDSPEKPKET